MNLINRRFKEDFYKCNTVQQISTKDQWNLSLIIEDSEDQKPNEFFSIQESIGSSELQFVKSSLKVSKAMKMQFSEYRALILKLQEKAELIAELNSQVERQQEII